jgi:hypothetical protein
LDEKGCKGSIEKIWNKIPPFKFFLLMGLMDGLGNILGLIAYVILWHNIGEEALLFFFPSLLLSKLDTDPLPSISFS